MQTYDYSKIPSFPDPGNAGRKGEISWVAPETYFDDLAVIMDLAPPLPGEEAIYVQFRSILAAVKADPSLKAVLLEAAKEADKELIAPLRDFSNVGVPVAHYWTTPKNGAGFGTDYLTRTAVAKSNIFVNQARETTYFYQDMDSQGKRLDGRNNYTITFAKDKLPPVKGFWSLTLYNAEHFFYPNPQGVYSLGTKNKDLKYNDDGSLTFYIQHESPGKDRESNWLPAPADVFSVYLRAYWPEEAVYTLKWTPPAVEKTR